MNDSPVSCPSADGKVYIMSLLGSNDLWGDAIQILQKLYNKLPSDKEIRLAKANSITLTSYREKKDKKQIVKRKFKKHKKNRAVVQKTR